MNDQPVMRMRDTIADSQEESQAVSQVHVCGVLIDCNAVDIFHNEIRPPIVCMSSVDQMCDGWMIQIGEKLSLFEKTISPCGPLNIGAEEFNCDLLLYFSVCPFSQIYRAHSAGPENPHRLVWTPMVAVVMFPQVEAEQRLNFGAHFLWNRPV